MDDAIDVLRSTVAESQWLRKTPLSNVDAQRLKLLEAAEAVLNETNQPQNADPTRVAQYHVMGSPSPQSGTRIVPTGAGRRAITTGGKGLAPWRASLAQAASWAAPDEPLSGPVEVRVTFRLAMPRSRPKYLQRLGRSPSSVKPDIDKLVRAVLDSLKQGGMIRDDSQVYRVEAVKHEVVGWTGADISIYIPVKEDP